MITDRIGQDEVLLSIIIIIKITISQKNSQVVKKGESFHSNTDKGGVKILRLPA